MFPTRQRLKCEVEASGCRCLKFNNVGDLRRKKIEEERQNTPTHTCKQIHTTHTATARPVAEGQSKGTCPLFNEIDGSSGPKHHMFNISVYGRGYNVKTLKICCFRFSSQKMNQRQGVRGFK